MEKRHRQVENKGFARRVVRAEDLDDERDGESIAHDGDPSDRAPAQNELGPRGVGSAMQADRRFGDDHDHRRDDEAGESSTQRPLQ